MLELQASLHNFYINVLSLQTQYTIVIEGFNASFCLDKIEALQKKTSNNAFISLQDLQFMQEISHYSNTLIDFLHELQDKYDEEFADKLNILIKENATIILESQELTPYITILESQDNEYVDFIAWACEREHLIFPYDLYYYKESFLNAKNDSMKLRPYLDSIMLRNYLYNLALHLIITTNSDDNMLFQKYNIQLGSFGFSNSVSDSTSSVGIALPNWFNDLSPSDSLLTQTPYGMKVLDIKSQLTNIIVMV